MSTYNPDALAELQEEFNTIIDRRNGLFALIYPTELKQPKARNYLEQGVMRRVSLIAQSVIHVFRLIPPDNTAIPSKETIDQATIHLHANYINLYGFMDCWAHVWASEYALDKGGKAVLKNSRIGIGPKYEEFRSFLNKSLVDYLSEREEWITGVSLLRHSLAHRVPPYIPPHMVDPSNEQPYRNLQEKWFNSLDPEERERLNGEMEAISHFKAFLVYDLDESPPIAFHAQLIADFLTVEEFSQRFVFAIRDNAKHP